MRSSITSLGILVLALITTSAQAAPTQTLQCQVMEVKYPTNETTVRTYTDTGKFSSDGTSGSYNIPSTPLDGNPDITFSASLVFSQRFYDGLPVGRVSLNNASMNVGAATNVGAKSGSEYSVQFLMFKNEVVTATCNLQ